MKVYIIDAFSDQPFTGNPAAVCPLERWIPDALMQNIAMENNQAETAYFVKEGDHYHIRWFTPHVEVDLCGHATLASAYVLYQYLGYTGDEIRFSTGKSGVLKVTRNGNLLTLDFPADTIQPLQPTAELLTAFQSRPVEIYKGKSDIMYVFESEAIIRSLQPDYHAIGSLPCRGVIATSKGDDLDFVSRWFGPQTGINEDPVTGSAHTTLTPYWSAQLKKKELRAAQLSPRGGQLICLNNNERVLISGKARTYLVGDIEIPIQKF
jgi:PhzF family phenazine biosynthesis protein